MLPPQCSESLLLGVRVDVCTNYKRNHVEEWHPSLLREEGLGKRERDGRCDPADAHDWPESGLDSRLDLMESPRAGNDGHGDKIDCVLDRGNL